MGVERRRMQCMLLFETIFDLVAALIMDASYLECIVNYMVRCY